MVLREHKDPLNTSRGIMGPLENSAGVQNNRGRLKQRFDLIRKLGQGTYGKVQLGIDKETGKEVAIKTIKKSKIETEADLIRIRREIQIMSSVRHPNIIHIYEVFENREKMVLVMEYAAGGELYDYLNERKILQEDEARRIFRQIASAVYYCHKNKICHRDLKLENILLDEKSNAKIADFGLSNVFDDVNLLKTFCGSPLYASPEIVKGTPYSGPEVDCWSLGVLLYTLVYGAMPYDGSNFKRLVKQISAGDYYEPKKPVEASPLIRRMLTVDPLKRATVEDICAHPWINQGFDEDCLKSAEDLAIQTPVRLDVLLTLAPNHNSIPNHASQIPSDGQASNLANEAAGLGESNTEISEPPKKPKLQNDKGDSKEKGKPEEPTKPKRKSQVKTKSKTSPLLNVIQDVEEEAEAELMEVQQCDEAAGPTQAQEDDEGDTLSEISEIQTLAEELGPKVKAAKSTTKVAKKEKASIAKINAKTEPSSEVKPKSQSALETPAAAAPPNKALETPAPSNKALETPAPSNKALETPAPSNKALETPPEKAPEELPSKSVVVKKKVVKPKVVAATPVEEVKKEENKPEPEVKPVVVVAAAPSAEKISADTLVETKNPTAPVPVASIPPIVSQPTPESSDKEGDSSADKKKKLIRQRSGSAGEVSPTRVERRNSKVISQKTAELIQNLETKTGTSSGGEGSGSGGSGNEGGKITSRPPGIKKLVIPSFKVSDAKNKFETKPPRPIVSSVMSQSKAAFEAKAQQSKPPTPPVEKSVSEVSKPVPKSSVVKTESNGAKSTTPIVKSKQEEAAPKVEPTPIEKPKPKPKEEEIKPKETLEKKPGATLTLSTEPPGKSPVASPKTKPKITKKPVTEESAPELSVETPKPIATPTPTIAAKSGKIQIPSAIVDTQQQQEIKPVLLDSGKGGPKTVAMVIKGKTTPSSSPTPTSSHHVQSTSPIPTPIQTPTPIAFETPSKNKEQAVKKISSVINKIVSSSSNDEKKFVPASPQIIKTEISFPVSATQSSERVIPIKFVEEDSNGTISPPPTTNPITPSTSAAASRTSIASSGRFPPSRFDSFKRFDSSCSLFSRQNSASDTESCTSIAPPLKLEVLKKSPREFLIPIKLEASGQTVTPKEEILSEILSEDDFRMDSRLRSGRFGKHKRYSSLLSDSSLDEEPSISITGVPKSSQSRRPSTTTSQTSGVNHARSRSQGDEPETPTSTFKRYRIKRPDLDRSDSFSSAEEDDEDFFEVFTADSLFSNLLDRVRNLTKKINRDGGTIGSMGPNWPGPNNDPMNFGLWNPSSSLRDLMDRAPSETHTFGSTGPGTVSMSTHRSFSREPSVSVTINTSGGPSGSNWRRSLSRDVSGGESDRSHRDKGGLSADVFETTTVRSVPLSLSSRRSPSYISQRSEPGPSGGDYSVGSSLSSRYGPSSSSAAGTSTATPTSSRPAYSRTMSSTDYSSINGPGISRTLPFRRSLKGFDRNTDYSSMDSMIGVVRGLGQSLIDSPSTFDPDSYLRQLRSLSKDRESDCSSSVSRMTSISEQEPNQMSNNLNPIEKGPSLSGELNEWVGGSNQDDILSKDGSSSIGNDSGSRLSVQEKMNNYQQYYQSLTSQSPFKRFQLASPSQIHGLQNSNSNSCFSVTSPNSSFSNSNQIGLARLNSSNGNNSSNNLHQSNSLIRPNTMYETIYNGENQSNSNNSRNLVSQKSQPVSLNQHQQDVNGAKNVSQGLSLSQPSPLQILSAPAPLSENNTNKQLAPQKQQAQSQPPSVSVSIKVKPSPSLGIMRQTPMRELGPTTQSGPIIITEDKRPSLLNQNQIPNQNQTSIPKWPGLNIQQYRPLSISSFPEPTTGSVVGQRAGSVSRVMSPPPRESNNEPLLVVAPVNRIPCETQRPVGIVMNSSSNALNPSNVNVQVVSSPNVQSPNINATNSNTNASISPKKKETVRATSVERITRFLERKSVPREMTPAPPPPPTETLKNEKIIPKIIEAPTEQLSLEKVPPVPTPKPKTKFLQSLERKWEKLTTSSSAKSIPTHSENNHNEIKSQNDLAKRALSPTFSTSTGISNPQTVNHEASSDNEDNSLGNEESKISESVLLQRAVSPEKKPKKFGSGTVNSMLGKFMKFEDTPPLAPTLSKIPSGKPPSGPQVSRIGRRVQSVYAGAASDSVLTLSSTHALRNTPALNNLSSIQGSSENLNNSVLTNGHTSLSNQNPNQTQAQTRCQLSPEPEADLIRTAEIAQQKRRSVRLDTRSSSPAPPSLIQPPSSPSFVQKAHQRPTSLGVFSSNSNSDLTKGPSMIPRLNQTSMSGGMMRSSQNLPESLSPPPVTSNPEPITIKSMSPPEITIHTGNNPCSPSDHGSALSPISPVSDSFDSSSVCSDKNDPKSNSILDEEESVSDRILRKSFYSRFNSLDRKARSSSLSAAGAARKNLQSRSYTSTIGNGSGSNNGTTKASSSNSTPGSGSSKSSTLPLMSLNHRAQSVERTLSPRNSHQRNRALSPDITYLTSMNGNSNGGGGGGGNDIKNGTNGSTNTRPKSPSPNPLVINKYNPNPLFKELITDEFKSGVEKKTEYSRRVTSKLSRLLRDIESDLNTCSLSKGRDDYDDDDDDEGAASGGGSNNGGMGIGLDSLIRNNNHSHSKSNPISYGGGAKDRLLNRRNHLLGRESSVQPEELAAAVSRSSKSLRKDDSNECMNER